MKPSPSFNVYYEHNPISLTLDTGAETNLIKECTALQLGLKITPSSQYATQADSSSQLKIIGETKLKVQRDNNDFFLDALVARNIDADVLAGIPFMSMTIRPANKEIMLSDGTIYHHNSPSSSTNDVHVIRRAHAVPLRAPSVSITIWPGEFIEVEDPEITKLDYSLALEPRIDTNQNQPKEHRHTMAGTCYGSKYFRKDTNTKSH